MVVRISDKTQNYSKVTKLLVKPIITFLKMFIFPCLAVSLLKFTNLSSMVKNGDMILLISLLASVAPTAASVTQIAQIYDADSEYASAYYFVTTLLCILTMPVFVWFYQL